MSKSIKQYKTAMDSIRISDSFMSRTEELMLEQEKSRVELKNGRKRRLGVRITMWAGAAAACFAAVLLIREGILQQNISTDTTVEFVQSETIISTTPAAEVGMEVEIEDEESFGIVSIQDKANEAVPQNEAAEKPAAASGNGGETDSSADVLPQQEDLSEGVALDAAPNFLAEDKNAGLADEIDFANSQCELASYVNSPDGQMLYYDLSAEEAVSLVTVLSAAVKASPIADENPNFTSEFVLTITNSSADEAYTFYLTPSNTIIINSVTSADSRSRLTYLLNAQQYSALEKQMYEFFGTESDYEAFSALKSGK